MMTLRSSSIGLKVAPYVELTEGSDPSDPPPNPLYARRRMKNIPIQDMRYIGWLAYLIMLKYVPRRLENGLRKITDFFLSVINALTNYASFRDADCLEFRKRQVHTVAGQRRPYYEIFLDWNACLAVCRDWLGAGRRHRVQQ
jgi:hypothetical protein